jgi:hypothetical protein
VVDYNSIALYEKHQPTRTNWMENSYTYSTKYKLLNPVTCCFSSSVSCSSSYIPCGAPSTVILSRSGLKSTIIAPGATRPGTIAGTKYPKPFLDKNAAWIWDSLGTAANCNMSIVISDTFYEKCPGQGITIEVAADSRFTLNVLGETKSSTAGPSNPSSYTFSTAGRSCSN